jgi:hypothetical protein
LSVHSLYAWRRKLTARDAEQRSGATAPRFVAVDVHAGLSASNAACLEITPDGTIRVPVELDADLLTIVLQAVRRSVTC